MDEMNLFLTADDGNLLKDFGELEDTEITPLGEEVLKKDDDDSEEATPPKKVEDTDLEETELVEEKDKVKAPPKASDKKDNSSTNILSSIVNVMQEEGFFDLKEGEELDVKNAEDFIKVITKIKESALESEKIDWSDNQKEYFEALKAGVPHEQIAQHQQRQQAYSSITEEAIEGEGEDAEVLRKNIIEAKFKAKGFTPEEAAKWAKRAVAEGSDIEDAKEALEDLKQMESSHFKQMRETQEKAVKEAEETNKNIRKEFNDYVAKTKEVIPGMTITSDMRKELVKGLTKPVSQDAEGNPLDLVGDYLSKGGYEARYKLAYLLKVTDGFKDMSKLSASKAKKDTTRKLEDLLNSPSTDMEFTKENSDGDAQNFDLDGLDKYLKD